MYRLLSSLLAIALLVSLNSAAPAIRQGRSFKVHQKRSNSINSRPGIHAMDRAYRKFGFPSLELDSDVDVVSHTISSSGSNGNTDGTINPIAPNADTAASKVDATAEEGDTEFLSPITIGGQTLNMDFDTGSSDLWVFNTQTPQNSVSGQTLFDPTQSQTFKPLDGASFSISYGDKSKAVGNVGLDTVNIGGAVVTNQAIELATDVTNSFVKDAKSDGLLGLAFSSLNTVQPEQQKTFFDNIRPSLAEPLFTANLRHASVGAYEFGRIDKSQFKGDLAYTPIDSSRGFWEFSSNSFAVGNGPVQSNPAASPAIADTGTSLMLVDDAVAKAYWGSVPGSFLDSAHKNYLFPCDSSLPDFHIALGDNYLATIPGELINFSRSSATTCFGGIQSTNGQKIQIYGDIMFKSQFVVFDGGNSRLGFAPHS